MLNEKKSFAYHIAFLQWKTRRITFRGLTHYINNKTLSTIIILFGIRLGKSITLVYPTPFLIPRGCCAYFHRLFHFPAIFLLLFFRCMYICFRFLLPTFWRLSYCTFALLVIAVSFLLLKINEEENDFDLFCVTLLPCHSQHPLILFQSFHLLFSYIIILTNCSFFISMLMKFVIKST